MRYTNHRKKPSWYLRHTSHVQSFFGVNQILCATEWWKSPTSFLPWPNVQYSLWCLVCSSTEVYFILFGGGFPSWSWKIIAEAMAWTLPKVLMHGDFLGAHKHTMAINLNMETTWLIYGLLWGSSQSTWYIN